MNLIISITALLALSGIAVFVWSILETRKRYYEDYLKMRENRND